MQTRSEETRNKILTAAYKLFSIEGYDATGVAEICQEAGVSKGAFYHHFPSKQDVFQEMMESWLSRLDAAFESTLQEDQDASQAIERMASAAVSVFKTADASLAIFLEFWRQAYRDQTVWKTAIEPYRRYRHYFSSLIAEGVSAGKLRPVDPDLAGSALVSLALGLMMQVIFDPQGADWGRETVLSVRLFMEGLKGESL